MIKAAKTQPAALVFPCVKRPVHSHTVGTAADEGYGVFCGGMSCDSFCLISWDMLVFLVFGFVFWFFLLPRDKYTAGF